MSQEEFEVAKEWLAVLNPRTRIHESPLVKVYWQFIVSWVAFVFILRKDLTGDEGSMLLEFKNRLTKEIANSFVTDYRKPIISLNSVRVKNETRSDGIEKSMILEKALKQWMTPEKNENNLAKRK